LTELHYPKVGRDQQFGKRCTSIVLYCIYTFIWRFLQCTPIRSVSSV